MRSVLAHPSDLTFAKISTGCNFYMGRELHPVVIAPAKDPLSGRDWNAGSGDGNEGGTKMFLQASVDNVSNGTDKRFAACRRRI
jgi:hypothetical protein